MSSGWQIPSDLGNKAKDKRKSAANEIDTYARKIMEARSAQHDPDPQIKFHVRVLVDVYCRSPFPWRRQGGLLGLASVAIALTHQQLQSHVSDLIPPVLVCFSDENHEVRYQACEAFYNIAKVARDGILSQFNQIFDGLCRLASDVDANVKEGGRCLDRLVRDIATETRSFSCAEVIPLLTTRIRIMNPMIRQLVLGWIVLLDSVPEVDMIVYLPQYLEGLFFILASDHRDIRRNAENHLKDLLEEIKGRAGDRESMQRAIAGAAPTVARCCRASERRPEDNYVRLTALSWLHEFVGMQERSEAAAVDSDQELVRPPAQPAAPASPSGTWRVSGGLRLTPASSVVAAAGKQRGEARERSESTGARGGLRQLVPVLLEGALPCLDDGEGEIRHNAERANDALRAAAQRLGGDLPVEALVDALLSAMRPGVSGGQEGSEKVLLACFCWARLLLDQCPERVLQPHVRDRLLDPALSALRHQDDEVATSSLRLISQLVAMSGGGAAAPASTADPKVTDLAGAQGLPASPQSEAVRQEPEPSSPTMDEHDDGKESSVFVVVCNRLFQMMSEEHSLPGTRSELAVRELCSGVDAQSFFKTAALRLSSERSPQIARDMVRLLNRVLLTSYETRALRKRLFAAAVSSPRPGAPGGGSDGVPPLLLDLLTSWFHCPVSTLSLCLWLQWFELAAEIVTRLAKLEITSEMREQLMQFIGLLESPVFMRVRLQLLETQRHPALLRAVLGLVALLPQEHLLQARLGVVETGLLLDRVNPSGCATAPPPKPPHPGIEGLLVRFDSVVDDHGWRRCVV